MGQPSSDRELELTLTRLGHYGLLPLILAAIAVWAAPWGMPFNIAMDMHQLALAYAGVVAAYLAGIGAGGAIAGGSREVSVAGGMVAVIVAWIAIGQASVLAIAPGNVWRYIAVIVVLAWLLARDLSAASSGALPAWYADLRTRLTLWASLLLALIALRLAALGAW